MAVKVRAAARRQPVRLLAALPVRTLATMAQMDAVKEAQSSDAWLGSNQFTSKKAFEGLHTGSVAPAQGPGIPERRRPVGPQRQEPQRRRRRTGKPAHRRGVRHMNCSNMESHGGSREGVLPAQSGQQETGGGLVRDVSPAGFCTRASCSRRSRARCPHTKCSISTFGAPDGGGGRHPEFQQLNS